MNRWLRLLALLFVLPGMLLPAGLQLRLCACAGLASMVANGGVCRCTVAPADADAAGHARSGADDVSAPACCAQQSPRATCAPAADHRRAGEPRHRTGHGHVQLPVAKLERRGCYRIELSTADQAAVAAGARAEVAPAAPLWLPASGILVAGPDSATSGRDEVPRAPVPRPRWARASIPLLI